MGGLIDLFLLGNMGCLCDPVFVVGLGGMCKLGGLVGLCDLGSLG